MKENITTIIWPVSATEEIRYIPCERELTLWVDGVRQANFMRHSILEDEASVFANLNYYVAQLRYSNRKHEHLMRRDDTSME